MASARLVLPSWLCPSSATLRILSGSSLAIASPFRRECKSKQHPSPAGGGQGGALVDRRERDDLDRLAGAHLSCSLWHDDEAIGIGHRAKYVRALVAGQPDTDQVAITTC